MYHTVLHILSEHFAFIVIKNLNKKKNKKKTQNKNKQQQRKQYKNRLIFDT
jgi:hypothetical protein